MEPKLLNMNEMGIENILLENDAWKTPANEEQNPEHQLMWFETMLLNQKKDNGDDDLNDDDDYYNNDEEEDNPYDIEPTDKDIVEDDFPLNPEEDIFDDEDDIPYN